MKKLTENFDKVGGKEYDDFQHRDHNFYYINHKCINKNLKETELYKEMRSKDIKCEEFSLIESYLQLKSTYFHTNKKIYNRDVAVFKCQQKILTLKNQVMNTYLDLNKSDGPEFLFSFQNSLDRLNKRIDALNESRENIKIKQQKTITLMKEVENFEYKTRSDIEKLDDKIRGLDHPFVK